jgi:hypothetical protein
MKPTLSRPASKLVSFLFCLHFIPSSDHNSPFSFWCLVVAVRGTSAAMIKRQKPVTSSSAQRSWFKASNGINGRGPPQAGRMPFMPAVSLNQRSGVLPAGRVVLIGVLLRLAVSFCFRLFCSSIFWLSRLLSERELLVVARFKLLSVGAGS